MITRQRKSIQTTPCWNTIVQNELQAFLSGDKRMWMAVGQRYYHADHDILHRARTVIGEHGQAEQAQNVSDNRIAHGFLRELIDQKTQYLLGRPYSIQTTEPWQNEMERVFGHVFSVLLRKVARDAICFGTGWIQTFIDEEGLIRFRRCNPMEMIPIWQDEAHTRLDAMIRLYEQEHIQGNTKKRIRKVECWNHDGVSFFDLRNGKLIPSQEQKAHVYIQNESGWMPANWNTIPFIPIKYNHDEMPLICEIKSLIDDYDRVVSDESNALADQPNSILVVRNYDGQKLGEFRRNLATYRAVKVSDDGGVNALNTPVDAQAANTHLERLRRDIYAFGRGVDVRNEAFSNAVSGVALKQAYAGLDLDCNGFEMEMRAGLLQAAYFAQCAAIANGHIDAEPADVEFVLNRDIIIHEQAAVQMCCDSLGVLSQETILANHPWVGKVSQEMERMQREKDEQGRVRNNPAGIAIPAPDRKKSTK